MVTVINGNQRVTDCQASPSSSTIAAYTASRSCSGFNDHHPGCTVHRLDAEGYPPPRADVHAAGVDRAYLSPAAVGLEPFLEPVAQVEVPDSFGGFGVFLGNALPQAALANEDEAAPRPFWFSLLHRVGDYCGCSAPKMLPSRSLKYASSPIPGISCLSNAIVPPLPTIAFSV